MLVQFFIKEHHGTPHECSQVIPQLILNKHQINVIDQLTNNIIGIDFMHCHKLHYDVQTCQVKIAGVEIDQIVAIKEQTLLALTYTVIMAKYKGKVDSSATYIANIFSPRTPMIS
jgi:hypothetical protein